MRWRAFGLNAATCFSIPDGTVIELTPVQAIEFANQIIRRVGRMAGGSNGTS